MATVALLRPVLAFVILSSMGFDASGQNASLRGRVSDYLDGSPLHGASIVLASPDSTMVGTSSDTQGYFLISRLTQGVYEITISFVGYATHRDTIAFEPEEKRRLSVSLTLESIFVSEVVIKGEGGGAQAAAQIGLATVSPRAPAFVPMPGLTPDLAYYLQSTPGIVALGDRGGQLYIRGGTPVQNLFLLDGIPIYQPLHIVGFYSAFPASIMAYSDVFVGGYDASFGGRLSAVVDFHARNGSKRRFIGAAAIGPFLASVTAEAPLWKDKVSLLVSLRESLIERLAPDLIGERLPYRFGDRFAKIHAFLSPTSHASFTAVSTSDEGNVAGTTGVVSDIWWNNRGVGSTYSYMPAQLAAVARFSVAVTSFDMGTGLRDAPEQRTAVDGLKVNMDFDYSLGVIEGRFGLFMETTWLKYNFDVATNPQDEQEALTEGGAFVQADVDVSNQFTVSPGIRLHSYASRGVSFFEPRLRLSYAVPQLGGSIVSGAWGMYHQHIEGRSSDRIITDVFTGWVPSTAGAPIPSAQHFLVGWRTPESSNPSLGVEGYRKTFDHMRFPSDIALLSAVTLFEEVEGDAVGVDVSAQFARRSFETVASYGYSSTEYTSESGPFRPPHDRRHHGNVVVNVFLRGFTLSGRFQIGSGLPFTQLAGVFDQVDIDPAAGTHLSDQGTPQYVLAVAYGGRLPLYHRFDLSLKKAFEFRRSRLTAEIGAINVYDQSNLFDFDLLTGTRVYQLPLIPTVSIQFETL